jgi:hypothetical protein
MSLYKKVFPKETDLSRLITNDLSRINIKIPPETIVSKRSDETIKRYAEQSKIQNANAERLSIFVARIIFNVIERENNLRQIIDLVTLDVYNQVAQYKKDYINECKEKTTVRPVKVKRISISITNKKRFEAVAIADANSVSNALAFCFEVKNKKWKVTELEVVNKRYSKR